MLAQPTTKQKDQPAIMAAIMDRKTPILLDREAHNQRPKVLFIRLF